MMQNLLNRNRARGPRAKAIFTKTLDHIDLWDTDLESESHKIACTAGVWTVIGRYQVKAQQLVRVGYGSPAFPDNQGYVYFALYDDTVTDSVLMEGTFRIVQRDYDNVVAIPVKDWHTRELRGTINDRRTMRPLPEQVQFPFVGRDSFIEVQFKAAVTGNLFDVAIGTAAGLDIWMLPVTISII